MAKCSHCGETKAAKFNKNCKYTCKVCHKIQGFDNYVKNKKLHLDFLIAEVRSNDTIARRAINDKLQRKIERIQRSLALNGV